MRLRSTRFPTKLLFDEISSFKSPAYFLRTLRNLFRRLHLERELARKDELLRAKEAENSELLQVGIALSAERDNNKLLDYILKQLRHIACADAGTLYLLERDEANGEQKLRFKITQNDSNPRDYSEFVMPLSKKTVSGYVASTGTVLNIEDAYKIPTGQGVRVQRQRTTSQPGYRSKSMLTVPMQDHKGEILGVIQLINRKADISAKIRTPEDAERFVVPFSHDIEPVVLSLASQAAVSLENNLLYQEIETLFEGFVKASVQAIESRDPTTSGHSNRVAVYTVSLAKAVEKTDQRGLPRRQLHPRAHEGDPLREPPPRFRQGRRARARPRESGEALSGPAEAGADALRVHEEGDALRPPEGALRLSPRAGAGRVPAA